GRPLSLVDGRAYAATWLHVRRTVKVRVDKKTDELVRHEPPIVETTRELFVVRDDGQVFGPGARPFAELGLDVQLPEPPRDGKLWRTGGIKAYRAGRRPDLGDVFARLVRVYDHYLDFGRSLADQREMCEVSACFSLATWLASAFDVLGYPWPNGDRGA